MNEITRMVAQRLNSGISINGIIVTRFNSTKKLNVSVDAKICETYGEIVFVIRIRENIKLAETPMKFIGVTEYAPD